MLVIADCATHDDHVIFRRPSSGCSLTSIRPSRRRPGSKVRRAAPSGRHHRSVHRRSRRSVRDVRRAAQCRGRRALPHSASPWTWNAWNARPWRPFYPERPATTVPCCNSYANHRTVQYFHVSTLAFLYFFIAFPCLHFTVLFTVLALLLSFVLCLSFSLLLFVR